MKKEKCKQCGQGIEDTPFFTSEDGSFIIPVYWAKDFKAIGRYYKKMIGETYKQNTGENIKDRFYQKEIELTHCGEDVLDTPQAKAHTFGKVLCWTDV